MRTVIIMLAALLYALPAHAALKVFACEPEWGALATELAGDRVELYVATTGRQDPHQIQARPSLIAKARQADLLVCTGAELEIGWLPMVQRQAGNPRIQPGAPGDFQAASAVRLLEIPTVLDRANGDVHASGNPHFQTDPRNIGLVAAALAQKLAALDAPNGAFYAARARDFATRWNAAIARWAGAAAALKDQPVAVSHHSWTYLFTWLGLREVIALEPKPGVPPSSGYLAQVLATVAAQPVKMVIRAAYEDPKPSEFLAERARIPAVELPFTVGGTDEAIDLFALFDDTIARLTKALAP
ncbi:MAG: zinc ABC transporter substrate-binding protein [Gammaproteobacteria bacterium]|nr:zinc ABC transporter substrate-binding protein [Gammaproteobacteria bacterium]MBI5615910.1 zinc ABC transporter substrate-binding protein [Gammaproteobacteria bacterium]